MWKDLTMSQRADMMDLYLSKGITSLDDMRSLYDSSISDTAQGTSFSDGGSIHIKPENRGKFTALKERTGHSATWFKEHGTPAQKKMATFALNARHWKHGFGGHIYDGLTEDTQQMNVPYAGELPDVTVRPRRIANKAWDKIQERWVGDMPTYYAVNPETGKEEMLREIGNGKYSTYDDKHVFDVLGAEAAKKEREQWVKNGGNASDFDKVMLGTLGLGLAPIALPEVAAGVGTALTNPYVDAGLTSYFGAHGLNHAINEGIDDWGDAAITALEIAPLGRLAKPVYEELVQPGMRLFNSPLTGNWTKIGNREYRLSPNSLGMNRVSVESKPARTVRLYRATGTNGNLEASLDGGQEFAGQWFTDNPTKPQHYASMTVKRAKRAGVDNPVELQYIDIPESELNKYRASEILKGRTDIEYEPTEDFLIPLDYPRQRVPLEGYTGNYLQDARRPLPELDIKSTTPQITAENAAENGMKTSTGSINVEHSLDNISRFEGSSHIPTGHQGTIGYRPKQKSAIWDSDKQEMVPLKSIDEVPNLRETINSIIHRIKTDDIRPEFLDENAYVNAFRDNATRQGINVNDLSHEDIAKILTEQYNQLKEGSSGILKDNVLWRTWGRTVPPNEFNWQEHLGEFTQNKGFWGEGNYFSTGVYGNSVANQPYMINDITAVGYDDLLGATAKAGDAIREGKIAGNQLATRWMSESPNTRIVAATENGARNRYGWLDTGDQGIEIVTQKNTGIKALNPDLTIGNGETFPRDWLNPNVFRGLLPFGIGLTGYGLYNSGK